LLNAFPARVNIDYEHGAITDKNGRER
jgi:hypothetical protein